MRGNLDRMMSDLERLKSGNSDQEAQRRALIGQLAQNNCGEQYRTAAAAAGPAGFFDALFGGNVISPGGDGAPSGTFRTVCVRTCDGFYFPVSYSTAQNRFTDDQRSCQRLCPATEAALYSFRNPGEDINQAVSVVSGQAYTELPNAFRYRREVTPGCSCRRPGQTWADALKNADDATTLESGDIVVTDEKAKALSQAPQGKPVKGGATPTDAKAKFRDAAGREGRLRDADCEHRRRQFQQAAGTHRRTAFRGRQQALGGGAGADPATIIRNPRLRPWRWRRSSPARGRAREARCPDRGTG